MQSRTIQTTLSPSWYELMKVRSYSFRKVKLLASHLNGFRIIWTNLGPYENWYGWTFSLYGFNFIHTWSSIIENLKLISLHSKKMSICIGHDQRVGMEKTNKCYLSIICKIIICFSQQQYVYRSLKNKMKFIARLVYCRNIEYEI